MEIKEMKKWKHAMLWIYHELGHDEMEEFINVIHQFNLIPEKDRVELSKYAEKIHLAFDSEEYLNEIFNYLNIANPDVEVIKQAILNQELHLHFALSNNEVVTGSFFPSIVRDSEVIFTVDINGVGSFTYYNFSRPLAKLVDCPVDGWMELYYSFLALDKIKLESLVG